MNLSSIFGGGVNTAPVSTAVADQAAADEQARLRRISTAWDRYNGDYDKPLAITDLDPKGEDNVLVNHSRRTVDISAFFLFGKEVGFVPDTGVEANDGDEPDTTAQDALAAVWKAQCDGMMPLLLEFATGAGVAGDGFIRVYEPDKANGEKYPRVADLDAENVTATYDPCDYRRVTEYKIQWTSIDASGTACVYRHLITRMGGGAKPWQITEQISRGDSTVFTNTAPPKRWPYSFCPIFHTKNRPLPQSFYGLSDIEDDVIGLNDAINFVLSNINRILRAHGHPFTYATGSQAVTIDRAVGNILWMQHPEAKVANVEMLSELGSSFSQLQELQDAYHQLTSIPEVTTGKLDNVGQLSGLALQILYGPIVNLTTVKRMLYGTMLEKLNVGLLEMVGITNIVGVKTTWPPILPTDPTQEANTATALQSAGVSQKTTLQSMGFDADKEEEQRNSESATRAKVAMQNFDRGKGAPGDLSNPKEPDEE